jgi:hypothetical protein
MSNQNQKSMKFDTHEELLSRVQRVEPPAFLFTRIEQRIKNSLDYSFSRKQLALVSISLAIVLSINVVAISKYANTVKQSANSIEALDNSMSLSTSNQLYNE